MPRQQSPLPTPAGPAKVAAAPGLTPGSSTLEGKPQSCACRQGPELADGPSQPGTPDAGPSGLEGSPGPTITPRRGAFSAEAILVDPVDPAGLKRKAVSSVQVGLLAVSEGSGRTSAHASAQEAATLVLYGNMRAVSEGEGQGQAATSGQNPQACAQRHVARP